MGKILTSQERALFEAAVAQATAEEELRTAEVASLTATLTEAQSRLALATANREAAEALRDKLFNLDA